MVGAQPRYVAVCSAYFWVEKEAELLKPAERKTQDRPNWDQEGDFFLPSIIKFIYRSGSQVQDNIS